MESIRQILARKVYGLIAGKKSIDITASTPTGNYFLTADQNLLGQFMTAIWGHHSKSSLITLYHTTGEIFAPVHEIADRVSGAVISLKKFSNDEVVYDNKYINTLLSNPNPFQNFKEFVYESIAYNLVAGENYMYANTPDFLPFSYKNIYTLLNLPADTVSVRYQNQIKMLSATTISDVVKQYEVQYGTTVTTIIPEHVLFTKVTSLYANDLKLVGRSPLLSVDKNICNLAAVMAARNTIYVKRGMLGAFVSQQSDAGGMVALTPSEKEEVIKDMDARYGVDGAKSPYAIIGAPLKWERVAMSIAELEPFKETLADAAAIYGVLQVPKELMPGSDGAATYENRVQAERIFYRSVIIPAAERFVQSLNNFLRLSEHGLYLDCSFDHIEALQENKKEKAEVDWKVNETWRVRFTSGVCTLNDWIVATGLEAVESGMYNKRLYDMSTEELAKVNEIMTLSKQTINVTSTGQQGNN